MDSLNVEIWTMDEAAIQQITTQTQTCISLAFPPTIRYDVGPWFPFAFVRYASLMQAP